MIATSMPLPPRSIPAELGAATLIERMDVDGDPEAPLLVFQQRLLNALELAPHEPRVISSPPQKRPLRGRLKRLF